MAIKNKDGEAFASLSVSIINTWDTKENLKEDIVRLDQKKPIDSLLTPQAPDRLISSVTASVSTKVSDSEYWGEGTFDRVQYSCSVLTTVTLNCDQNEDTILLAHGIAYDLAWEANQEHMGKTIVSHTKDIRTRLFPELFHD